MCVCVLVCVAGLTLTSSFISLASDQKARAIITQIFANNNDQATPLKPGYTNWAGSTAEAAAKAKAEAEAEL